MEKSRGSKKALRAVVTMAALVAALATTGCTGGTLMGPESGTTNQDQVASQAGNTMKPAGNTMNP